MPSTSRQRSCPNPSKLTLRAYAFQATSFTGEIQFSTLEHGSTHHHLYRRTLKTDVLVPPLPEQTAIAEVLSDMDAELAALEQRRDKTRALKQGMMQELLTGRTRLV